MLYELENGELINKGNVSGNYKLDLLDNNLYMFDLNENNIVIINSIQDRCFIMSKKLFKEGVDLLTYNEITSDLPREDMSYFNKYSNCVTFILAITYKCNMHCTYCYQQNDPYLNKEQISESNLNKILHVIEEYMKKHPEKSIELGLFGGEPLLIENEKIIDIVFEFCKKHGLRVHITTNGSFLDYYLKKLIINRRFIRAINPTIDSLELNSLTRHNLNKQKNKLEETTKLLRCIKTLLYYGIHINLATNLDRHNYNDIVKIKNDLEKLNLLTNKNFTWSLGRVDDRLYETEFPDIIMESQIIPKLQNIEITSNTHAAFLKICYCLVKKMGLQFNQKELKSSHSYCWCSSGIDNVFYIDNKLKTYRCTYTVGRPQYSLFDFSLENLENYKKSTITYQNYPECNTCNIRGYCCGGCQLSHKADFERCCSYEKETFSYFIENTFLPFLRNKYNEVHTIEQTY